MTDLTNPFPDHGSTGSKPPNGLDKSGGDQYEAPYFDYYANSWNKSVDGINESISRRTTHLHGDRVLDGLDIEQDGGRTLVVTSSSGAYVSGQFTGPIEQNTLVLSSNNSGRNRTDSIYVGQYGSVATKTGQNTVPESTYKLGEVTVSPNNVITSVQDTALQRTHSGVAQTRPSDAHDGDTLYNMQGSPSSRGNESTYEVWENGEGWQPLLFADGRQERTDHQYYGGNNIYNVGNIYDETGDSLTDKFVNVSGDTMTGQLTMGDNWVAGVKNPTNPKHAVNLRYLENNYAPDNHLHDGRYVNESGDTMTGNLHMSSAKISLGGGSKHSYISRSSHELEIVMDEGSDNPKYDFTLAKGGHPETTDGKDVFHVDPSGITWEGNEVWHESNDGAGSGLDADKLDGTHEYEFGKLDQNENVVGRWDFRKGAKLHKSQANWLTVNQIHGLNAGANEILMEDQTRFNGGSVYWSNMSGSGNNNDSYDAVWQNEPTGKDFRIHMKRNPEDSALVKDYGMLFSTEGNHNGPIIACEVDSGITHVKEIRSVRDERSGTPIAQGDLAPYADIGEIWYDFDVDEYRGQKRNGQTVKFVTQAL